MLRHPTLIGRDGVVVGYLRHVELLVQPGLVSQRLEIGGIGRRGTEGRLFQEAPRGRGGDLRVRYADLYSEWLRRDKTVAHRDTARAGHAGESRRGQSSVRKGRAERRTVQHGDGRRSETASRDGGRE